jgi:lipopolysaccharide biosynthesis protein
MLRNYSHLYLRILARSLSAFSRLSKSYREQSSSIRSSHIDLPREREELSAGQGDTYIAHLTFSSLLKYLRFRLSREVNASEEEVRQSWLEISQSSAEISDSNNRIDLEANLVLHVHYLDIAVEILDFISSQNVRFKNVIVTTTGEETVSFLQAAIEAITFEKATVIAVENSFRDARPFLIALGMLENRLPLLKIHTKKSPHLGAKDGETWRREMIAGLIPSAKTAQVFTQWLRGESVPTVICPASWVSIKREWGHNDLHVFSLCAELGISMRRKAPFPKGTMFWINSALIESMKTLNIPTIQADSEKNWTDSTWAHGLERVVGQIVINGGRGYQWKRSEPQE